MGKMGKTREKNLLQLALMGFDDYGNGFGDTEYERK